MSAYCDQDDVKNYLGVLKWNQLTADVDEAGDTGVGDTGVYIGDTNINNACESQSRFIDSYLMGRYTTPIIGPTEVMDALKVHCVRLAIYALFQARLMAEDYQTFQTDRDITIKWLESIAANKASLPGQTPPTITLTTGMSVGGSMLQVFGTDDPLF